MFKDQLRSQFVFNQEERVGILSLVAVIIIGLGVYRYTDENVEVDIDLTSEDIQRFSKEIDSLRALALEARKPKLYPFNPNFITDHKAYTLGMTPEEFDRLKEFRANDRWVNSSTQFQAVTRVSDSLLAAISPYFKFPEWVTQLKKQAAFSTFQKKSPPPKGQRKDLNSATVLQLQEVYGIGPAFSQRIVAYRDKIGGFRQEAQLYEVWGLKQETIEEVLKYFMVASPRAILRYDINTASASDLATIPGISFDLAKEIWEFRRLRERIDSIEELQKIDALTAHQFKLIQLYLSVD